MGSAPVSGGWEGWRSKCRCHAVARGQASSLWEPLAFSVGPEAQDHRTGTGRLPVQMRHAELSPHSTHRVPAWPPPHPCGRPQRPLSPELQSQAILVAPPQLKPARGLGLSGLRDPSYPLPRSLGSARGFVGQCPHSACPGHSATRSQDVPSEGGVAAPQQTGPALDCAGEDVAWSSGCVSPEHHPWELSQVH